MSRETKTTLFVAFVAGVIAGSAITEFRSLQQRLAWPTIIAYRMPRLDDALLAAIRNAGWRNSEVTPINRDLARLTCIVKGVTYYVTVKLDQEGRILPIAMFSASDECEHSIARTRNLPNTKAKMIKYIQHLADNPLS